MSRKTIDITGQKFRMLTVVEKVGATETNISLWKCKCDCGNEKVVPRKNLIGGGTRSCGCLHSKKQLQHGNAVRGSRTKLYNIWISMRQRCSNSSHRYYKRYGGRGISVCGEWDTFEAFEKWALRNGYSPRTDSQNPGEMIWKDVVIAENR